MLSSDQMVALDKMRIFLLQVYSSHDVTWCLMSAHLQSQDQQFNWQSGWHPVTNDLPLVVTLCGAVKIKKPIEITCLPPKESTVPWKNHDKTVPQAKGPSRAAFAALISLIARELINASSTHLSIFYHHLSCTQGHRGWCQSQLICSEDRVRHGHVLSLINTSFNPYLSIPKKTTKWHICIL